MQKVDLFQSIMSVRVGPPPVTLKVTTTQTAGMAVGGTMSNLSRIETYVLLSALPEELRERVKLAVQALSAGM